MKIFREPLVQFLILGVIFFAVYLFGHRLLAEDESLTIEIDANEVQFLADSWSKRWQRPPTQEELKAVVDAQIRQEILYREAVAVGLDTNDVIVQQRMVQKMEMLSEDLATLNDPTDAELEVWWKERESDYRLPPQLSFTHIYFNPDERGPELLDEMALILEGLRTKDPVPSAAPELGDRFMLGYECTRYTPAEVRREYGEAFTEAIFALDLGWHGPVLSGFGPHLVFVGERIEGRDPEFAAVRGKLVMDYNRMRRDRTRDQLYEGLRARYEVNIDEEAIRAAAIPTP